MTTLNCSHIVFLIQSKPKSRLKLRLKPKTKLRPEVKVEPQTEAEAKSKTPSGLTPGIVK